MTTVAILYPGEMGAALAQDLADSGHRVVTTLAGRGDRTRERVAAGSIEVLDGLAETLTSAEIVLSLVPPRAAFSVARTIARQAIRLDPSRLPIYVDLNSTSPLTARRTSGLLASHRIDFVDGGIHGLASRLRSDGVIYLSGKRAGEIEALFAGSLRIRNLGEGDDQASSFKMLTGGLNKGLAALFIELACGAERAGLLGPLLDAYDQQYPGIMEVVARILPSYLQHAPRREDELRELERTMRAWGNLATVIPGARRSIGRIARKPVEASGDTEIARDLAALINAWSPALRLESPERRPGLRSER